MLSFPNAKINLGLRVLQRRPDAYHNIESLLLPIGLHDILEIQIAKNGHDTLRLTGLPVAGPHGENLCMKALQLLRNDFTIPAVEVSLHKNIPSGAGLGGGSSDAAFMLRMLNEKFCLKIPKNALADYALRLGSDCPFFVYNTPMIARGRGELLSPYAVSLSGTKLLVVKPPLGVSTAKAYENVVLQTEYAPFEECLQQRDEWHNKLTNSFEAHIFAAFPEIGELKKRLYSAGAFYAQMSGSGSALFGLFDQPANTSDLFPGCFVWEEML
jgi:4-diphosphocytidyl-2-C-methyl-D-erythritol kinase